MPAPPRARRCPIIGAGGRDRTEPMVPTAGVGLPPMSRPRRGGRSWRAPPAASRLGAVPAPSHVPLLIGSLADLDHHDTGRGHPERPARLTAALAGIVDADLGEAVRPLTIRPAGRDELARVHDPRYLDAIAGFAAVG